MKLAPSYRANSTDPITRLLAYFAELAKYRMEAFKPADMANLARPQPFSDGRLATPPFKGGRLTGAICSKGMVVSNWQSKVTFHR